MTAPPLADPRVQLGLFRSALYEALALGFAYPTAELTGRLTILIEDMLAFEAETDPGLLDDLRHILEALQCVDPEALAVEHNRLFDQSALCSPFETEYEVDPFAKSRQLADISGFYHAFNMAASRQHPTTQDFIGSELEFMSLLTRREAYATAKNWIRRREVTTDAERSFLRDHLGRWERTFCGDVARNADEETPPGRFYSLLSVVCTRFVEDELRRHGARPLRLKQRMLAGQEPFDCPIAPAAEDSPDPDLVPEAPEPPQP